MFESTVHFTGMGILFAVAAPCIVVFFLWLLGRSVPPAVRPTGRPAGVGGLLLVVLLILSAKAVVSLFALGQQAGECVRVVSMSPDFLWPAVKSTLPAAVNAVAIMLALVLLTLGRSPAALFTALVAVWVAGPGDDFLKSVILGVPFNPSQGFMGISFFTIIVTVYLLFSSRSAHTYGLPSARRAARY
ncbi:hypothetical protein [Sutterella sp.]|uniref:hypothetical protein n=1 Tax=Sutterella sp. TaxID=1981025 RepID=UPI0026E0E975|nr:hypothetical protein [Sutterella sp.]MDO5530975.1 hypothetical protein [Sutterella sp.]